MCVCVCVFICIYTLTFSVDVCRRDREADSVRTRRDRILRGQAPGQQARPKAVRTATHAKASLQGITV